MTWHGKASKFAMCFPLVAIGCNDLPPKPDGDLCTIDLPRNQLVCSEIPKNDTDQPGKRYKLPIANADRYVCFSPDHWENIVNYIHALKDAAERKRAQLEALGVKVD